MAASKKGAEPANGKIAAAMDAFIQQHPDWEHQLDQALAHPDDDISDEMKPIAEALGEFLSEACTEIRRGAMDEAELLKLFPQKFYPLVQELTEQQLRVFHAFHPLRAIYEESPSKVENLIDQIWQQYVIRFNPHRKIERPGSMTDDDMSNLENALDSFADYCCVRTLHYDAIIQRIKLEAPLPDGLCAYIARKIDKDYQELRLNYIVSYLERLSGQEDDSDE